MDFIIYIILQVLDLATTYLGIETHLLGEANPVALWITSFAPNFWIGLIALKILVGIVAYYLYKCGRADAVRFMNYCFVGVVTWNLAWILFILIR